MVWFHELIRFFFLFNLSWDSAICNKKSSDDEHNLVLFSRRLEVWTRKKVRIDAGVSSSMDSGTKTENAGRQV